MDTCLNYTTDRAYFSSDERKWINKIHKLKETYPEDVLIKAEPETNDGCIYCEFPKEWLKIQPPRRVRDYTEEELQALRDRLARGRSSKLTDNL